MNPYPRRLAMSDPLSSAIALVKFGPCKSAECPQDWVNVAVPMCAHCEGVEDINLAAARIILGRLEAVQSERDRLREALRLAAMWGVQSRGFSASIAVDLRNWIDSGMIGPEPKAPSYYPK
jgi:hypothetical protein